MKRVAHDFFGITRRIPPQEGGAVTQCLFCEWGRFFKDRKRARYSALARARASLRSHVRRQHRDKFLEVWDPSKGGES